MNLGRLDFRLRVRILPVRLGEGRGGRDLELNLVNLSRCDDMLLVTILQELLYILWTQHWDHGPGDPMVPGGEGLGGDSGIGRCEKLCGTGWCVLSQAPSEIMLPLNTAPCMVRLSVFSTQTGSSSHVHGVEGA